MQFTVLPASSQACSAAIRALLSHESAPTVIGICRNDAKIPQDIRDHPRFWFTRGDLDSPETLDFAGSAGVLVTTPASFADPDAHAYTRRIATNIRNAVVKSGSVKKLVYISSLGAQHSTGVGEVRSNHESEVILRDAADEVVFVRNAYFMDNWTPALQTVRADPPFFYSCITPADFKMPMVSSRDVGRTCATQLLRAPTDPQDAPRIVKLQGPGWYSTNDVRDILVSLTGKKVEARLIGREGLAGFFGAVLPPHLVRDFVEMTESFLPGGLLEKEMRTLEGDSRVLRGEDDLFGVLKRAWDVQESVAVGSQ